MEKIEYKKEDIEKIEKYLAEVHMEKFVDPLLVEIGEVELVKHKGEYCVLNHIDKDYHMEFEGFYAPEPIWSLKCLRGKESDGQFYDSSFEMIAFLGFSWKLKAVPGPGGWENASGYLRLIVTDEISGDQWHEPAGESMDFYEYLNRVLWCIWRSRSDEFAPVTPDYRLN